MNAKSNACFPLPTLILILSKALKYKLLIGGGLKIFDQGIFEGNSPIPGKNGTPFASTFKGEQSGYTLENILTYDKTFGEHSFGITALQSAAGQEYNTSTMGAQNLPYETAKWYNLGTRYAHCEQHKFRRVSIAFIYGSH